MNPKEFTFGIRFVQGYTDRSITLTEDCLPAISGILNELARVWNSKHIHGTSDVEAEISLTLQRKETTSSTEPGSWLSLVKIHPRKRPR